MKFYPVIKIIGIFLLILGFSMLFPALIDGLYGSQNYRVFILSSLITSLAGFVLILSVWGKEQQLGLREAFLLTTLTWVLIAIFSSIPIYISDSGLSFTDAFFESMSGITTTGATVIENLEIQSKGILIWRALLQWLGGIGIIVMAVAVLPMLQVGGMQLFRLESSDNAEKILPRATQLAGSLVLLYVIITMACALAYNIGGMGLFDSLAHALTTISTGGFSTHTDSFAYFSNSNLEYMAVIFMILGSLPFVLYLQFVRGKVSSLFMDSQVIAFFIILLVSVFLCILYIQYNTGMVGSELIRKSLFNVTSILTGTGYVSADYMQWGPFIISLFFILMLIGGCAGSTSCGLKVFRVQILYKQVIIQTKKIAFPDAVFVPLYNGKEIPDSVSKAVTSFFLLFIVSFVIIGLVLSLSGLDLITAFSAAASAISNVGPGLGTVVGPTETYSSIDSMSKWILSFAMLLGRLEILTVMVIFTSYFWRQ
ncbi:MAG: TrkH family potassium uptake protein [Rhizobiales bacterium]|nr:TrkH family potassium uptake protein [Hyphomicrobiales bacterium]MBL6770157.1 TrkH family potassium uptake protein [Hyphomicrobiales bacterium]